MKAFSLIVQVKFLSLNKKKSLKNVHVSHKNIDEFCVVNDDVKTYYVSDKIFEMECTVANVPTLNL